MRDGDVTGEWRGLVVCNGRLRYPRPRRDWWRPVLEFMAEGLVLRERDGTSELFEWDQPSGRWWSVVAHEAQGRPPISRAGVRLLIGHGTVTDLWAAQWLVDRSVWLPSTFRRVPVEELPALVGYLQTTPEARSGLDAPARLGALLAGLASRSWERPRPRSEPLLGDRLDLFLAIERAVEALGWRRFGGRPVRGEPTPDVEAITRVIRARLLPGVSARIDDGLMTSTVEDHLQVGAWPFDELLTP